MCANQQTYKQTNRMPCDKSIELNEPNYNKQVYEYWEIDSKK